MNWTKKPKMRRVKERFLQALGVHQQSSYPEFDERLKHFLEVMSALHQIYDSLEIYIDLIDSMSQVMLNLTDSFLNLQSKSVSQKKGYTPMTDLAKSFQLLASIYKDIHDSVNPELKIVFEDRCILPIKSLLSREDVIKAKYHERNKILLEYDSLTSAAKAELAAGKDETHPNVIKLQSKVDTATLALNNIHEDINQSLNEFECLYPTVLSPCFASMVGCTYYHGTTSDNLLTKVIPYLPESASSICALAHVATVYDISTTSHIATLKANSHTAHALAGMQYIAIAHLVDRNGSVEEDDLLALAIGSEGLLPQQPHVGGAHRRSAAYLMTESTHGDITDSSSATTYRKGSVVAEGAVDLSTSTHGGSAGSVGTTDFGRSVRGAITDTMSTLGSIGSLAASHIRLPTPGRERSMSVSNSSKLTDKGSEKTQLADRRLDTTDRPSGGGGSTVSSKDKSSPYSRASSRANSQHSSDRVESSSDR